MRAKAYGIVYLLTLNTCTGRACSAFATDTLKAQLGLGPNLVIQVV